MVGAINGNSSVYGIDPQTTGQNDQLAAVLAQTAYPPIVPDQFVNANPQNTQQKPGILHNKYVQLALVGLAVVGGYLIGNHYGVFDRLLGNKAEKATQEAAKKLDLKGASKAITDAIKNTQTAIGEHLKPINAELEKLGQSITDIFKRTEIPKKG